LTRDSDDTVNGGSGDDNLDGGTGNDLLSYGGSTNGVTDGAGNDLLSGLGGIDTISGETGDDTVLSDAGDDSLVGGVGNDLADYSGASDSVVADLGAGTVSGAARNDRISRFESVIGTGSADTLAGGNADEFLSGGNGSDSLADGNGTDSLYGGDEADVLSGGAGNDWLYFGAGNDVFRYLTTDNFGNETLIGGAGFDVLDFVVGWSALVDGSNPKDPPPSEFVNYQRADGTVIWTQGWESVICFAEGTRVMTPSGEAAVENLRAGDMVLAMRGGEAGFETLRWVGSIDVAVPRDAVMAAKTAPILITACALADGLPARDLRVSPDHAIEVDG